jgi:uncharacterized membrane protein YsdA (DUF1294 family)/cold shock CspA family protein
MRHKGRVIEWNDERGYGFVTPMVGKERVFLHIKSISRRLRRPVVGDLVIYELKRDEAGRAQAANVTFSGDQPAPRKARAPRRWPLMVALAFCLLVIVLVARGRLTPIALAFYPLIGGVTYIAYAWDKSSARMGHWRTPENTLLLLGLAGGWPAALIAQQRLRHKSAKVSFLVLFWGSVVLHCAALAALVANPDLVIGGWPIPGN